MSQAENTYTTALPRRAILSALCLPLLNSLASAAPPPVSESRASFEHPAEYLAAMQAIGWRVYAAYRVGADGSVDMMGVYESANQEITHALWQQYHAIQIRIPVNYARGGSQPVWRKRVEAYLHERGLSENITPAIQERKGDSNV